MPDSKSKADSGATPSPRPDLPRAPKRSAASATPQPTNEAPPQKATGPRPKLPTGRPLSASYGPSPETPPDQVRLAVGAIVGTHGIEGELKMRLTTTDPDHLRNIKRVWIGQEVEPRRLKSVRFHSGMALITIGGVTNPEQGTLLRGLPVRIAGSDARPLAPGEFFLYQVIGLKVFNEAGEELGEVTDLMETGANDVFVVKSATGGPDILYPNIPDVIVDLDPAGGCLVVRPLRYWDDE